VPVSGGDWGERARVPFNAPENSFYSRREAAEISSPFSAESAARRAAMLLVNLARRCSAGCAAELGSIDDRFSRLAASPYPMLNSSESAADRAKSDAMGDTSVRGIRPAIDADILSKLLQGLWMDSDSEPGRDFRDRFDGLPIWPRC
jgi:hypothetical protein